MDLDRILKESYTPRDGGAVVNTSNFQGLRANLARPIHERGFSALVMPQLSGQGRRGGVYKYAHLFELALHVYLDHLTKFEVMAIIRAAKAGAWGQRVLKSINSLSAKERAAVQHGGSFDQDEDPFGFAWYVDFAPLAFGPKVISRDPGNPTVWLVKPRTVTVGGGDQEVRADFVELDGEIRLADAWNGFVNAVCEGARDEQTRAMVSERRFGPLVINVTDLLNMLDARLELRLVARDLGAAE